MGQHLLCILIAMTIPISTGLSQDLKAFVPISLNAPQAQPYIKLIKRISELSGIPFILQDDLPRPRAIQDLAQGKIDCIIPGTRPVMAKVWDSVFEVPEVFLPGKNWVYSINPFEYKSQKSLEGKTVIVDKTSSAALVIGRNTMINVLDAPDSTSAVKMLLAGRAPLLIMNDSSFDNIHDINPDIRAKTFYRSEIPFVEIPNMIYLSLKKKHLAGALEEAMKKLKATGEYQRILGH